MPFSATLLLAKVPPAVYNVRQVCVANFMTTFCQEYFFKKSLQSMNRFFNNLQKNNSQILYLFFPFLFKLAVVFNHILNSFLVVWKFFC